MDAVEYVKEKGRLTHNCALVCRLCRFSLMFEAGGCPAWEGNNPEQAVAIIEQWAKDCPEETYRTKFLKAFPKAGISLFTFPCINKIFGDGTGKCQGGPTCAKCWGQPYKEENE